MKKMLMAIMAVAVAVTFSAPAFAADKPKEEKKGGKFVETIYADEKKKEEKKAPKGDIFADADKKKEEKGK